MISQPFLFDIDEERVYVKGYAVSKIRKCSADDYILKIHYAKCWPSVSYCYGLFENEKLVGVVCYGTPFSSSLRVGVAGKNYEDNVLELNRLVLKNNRKNEASILVGRSLKKLPKNKIVISYADTAQNHTGYVYQATNFIYTGLSAKRTNWQVEGKEELHGQTIADEFRGQKNRAQKMREKYGDKFKLVERSRKHRYVFIHGDKKWKKKALAALMYKKRPYPKKGEER